MTTLKENSVNCDSKLSHVQPPALRNVYFTKNHIDAKEFQKMQVNQMLKETSPSGRNGS